jgi:glutamyl-tRNA reductase
MREKLAFSPTQLRDAHVRLRQLFPEAEAVLLSTCNRVELYFAAEEATLCPTHHQIVEFLADFHGLDPAGFFDDLFERTGEDAVRHLFTVAASLDSMVVGEAQILPQVKTAYEQATASENTGPITHSAFQAAIRVARRIARDTSINQRRVSIPSVAVADFAKGFFERFDDKKVLVIGAGEMAEETLRYLIDEGARDITIVNRNRERAERLADEVTGLVRPWEQLDEQLKRADLVVTTTGASEPIVDEERFKAIHLGRSKRPLFILDLAVPRDFSARVGDYSDVYLYSIDDLSKTCEANKLARKKEWPKAERIIEEETAQFMADLNHRATGPVIKRLRAQADEIKNDELSRLLNKLTGLDDRSRQYIEQAFNRLVNKVLHPPLESLRAEAQQGSPHGLLEALKRLFQIKD